MQNPFKKMFSMQEKEQINPEHNAEQEEFDVNLANELDTDSQNDTIPAEDEAITALNKQLDDAKAKYLYLAADFENYKRHTARERVEMIQSAGKEIVAAMLPILDDFERAQKNSGLSDGMQLIHQKLINILRSKGLSAVNIKIGDSFNADTQEAVTEIPAATEELKGKIVDILEPGYQMGERMIRFAKVVVGK
jgi:molecular chaperone GrpE